MTKKAEQIARHLANTMLLNGMMQSMWEDRLENEREYWKAQNEKREKEYRQSMEYKQKRAKKKANRKLRKKSQGRC
jgi:hypothetical protein